MLGVTGGYMKNLRTLICGLVIFTLGAIALRADEWDKKTVITVNQPIEIAGTSLPPGTYVLMLDRGSQAERHIVRIKDAAAQKLITTVIAYPNYRVNVTSEPQLTFWEVPKGNPSALRA